MPRFRFSGGYDGQVGPLQTTDDLLTHPIFLLLWKVWFLQNLGEAQLIQLQLAQRTQLNGAKQPRYTNLKPNIGFVFQSVM